jgi:ABC-type dipeptide/oligopeptide/nickel transport system permease subunit
VGATAALGRRWIDGTLMRLTDLAYAFPDLLAIILLRAALTGRDWPILGTGQPQVPGLPGPMLQVVLAISLVSWVTLARLVRIQVLSLRARDYILAAEASGASTWRIATRHIAPNAAGPVIVAVTFGIPSAIFAEAVLGFIGFGLPPPTASLGTLVAEGYVYARQNPWMVLVPSAVLALVTLCFTFAGDWLRDWLDPHLRH